MLFPTASICPNASRSAFGVAAAGNGKTYIVPLEDLGPGIL